MLAINLVGVLNCTYAALPGMQEAQIRPHRQHLLRGGPGRLQGLGRLLGRQGRRRSASPRRSPARTPATAITANAIAPGPIETPLLMGAKEFGEIGEKVIETMKRLDPAGPPRPARRGRGRGRLPRLRRRHLRHRRDPGRQRRPRHGLSQPQSCCEDRGLGRGRVRPVGDFEPLWAAQLANRAVERRLGAWRSASTGWSRGGSCSSLASRERRSSIALRQGGLHPVRPWRLCGGPARTHSTRALDGGGARLRRGAVLSHSSAAALWRIGVERRWRDRGFRTQPVLATSPGASSSSPRRRCGRATSRPSTASR